MPINLITYFSSTNESKHFLTLFILSEVINSITLLSILCMIFSLSFKGYPSVLPDHDWTIQSVHASSSYYTWLPWLCIALDFYQPLCLFWAIIIRRLVIILQQWPNGLYIVANCCIISPSSFHTLGWMPSKTWPCTHLYLVISSTSIRAH